MIICAYLVASQLSSSMPPMVAVGKRPDGVRRDRRIELGDVAGILAEDGWCADDWVSFERIDTGAGDYCLGHALVQVEGSRLCLHCAQSAIFHLQQGHKVWRW